MSTSDLPAEESDLSLVSGGPIYRRLEKIGIARAGLTGLKIRLILCVLITWVPIVVLCWWQGRQSSAPLLQGFLSNFLESIRFLGDHASARICRIANKAVGHSRGAIFRQKRLDSGRAVE
jgi:hypothetical protein